MKIALILPGVGSFQKLRIHFGLAYLAGFLRKNGYQDIRFFSFERVEDYIDVVNSLAEYHPNVVGFTSVETQFPHVIALSALIKKAFKCVIICGGTLPTIYPECIRNAPDLDGIFIGESEEAFVKFISLIDQKKDYLKCENFTYYDKKSNQIYKNDLFPLIEELDRIGYSDKEIFDFQGVIKYYSGIAPFLFNRGCPFNCSFCSNHALASVYGKKHNFTRRRSIDSCISEIKETDKKYKFDAIDIWDDLFTSDRKWIYGFLDKYKTSINKPFICTARSNLCDDELFRRLKESGCYRVHMAIESGNEFIRNKVLNRNISQAVVIQSYELAKKYKLQINATAIIGIPFETESMIKETISLLGKLKVDTVFANIFYPYCGTRLREVCEQYGMVADKKIYVEEERRDTLLRLPHLDSKRLIYYRDNFELLVRKEESVFKYMVIKFKRTVIKILKLILGNNYSVIRKLILGCKDF